MTAPTVTSVHVVEYRSDSGIVGSPASPRCPGRSPRTSRLDPGRRRDRAGPPVANRQTATVTGHASRLVAWPFDAAQPARPGPAARCGSRVPTAAASAWSEPDPVVAASPGRWRVGGTAFIGLRRARRPRAAGPAAAPSSMVTATVARPPCTPPPTASTRSRSTGTRSTTRSSSRGGPPTSTGSCTRPPTSPACSSSDATRSASGWPAAGTPSSYGFRGQAEPFYGEPAGVRRPARHRLRRRRRDTVVRTGADWRACGAGPIVRSGIYAGETYDARRADRGWSRPGLRRRRLGRRSRGTSRRRSPRPAIAAGGRASRNSRSREVITSPVRRAPSSTSARTWSAGSGSASRGDAGHTVTLRHAEVLEHGELGVRPLRRATATDTLHPGRRRRSEVWEPSFTFHGFRYVEVDGWPGDARPGGRHRRRHPQRHARAPGGSSARTRW